MAIWHRVLHWFYSRRLSRLTEIIVKNNQERELKMKLNSQICTTKEQSERLLSLGLKKETADMCLAYKTHDIDGTEIPPEYLGLCEWHGEEERQTVLFSKQKFIPAWSLHRLIKFVPVVLYSRPVLHLTTLGESVFYCTEDNDEAYEKSFSAHLDLYDNMIDCIEWLVRNGYVDKEFING